MIAKPMSKAQKSHNLLTKNMNQNVMDNYMSYISGPGEIGPGSSKKQRILTGKMSSKSDKKVFAKRRRINKKSFSSKRNDVGRYQPYPSDRSTGVVLE